jgi:anaerobic magnesium-protoporphyrin IX monomethyl ester cyclase
VSFSSILSPVKVLLIQPPIEDFYDTAIRTYPLGLLYLAAKIGDTCNVSLADFRTTGKKRIIAPHPFPEMNDYYRTGLVTPFSLFGNYYRFGCSRDEMKDTIAREDPDVVCISSLFTTYAAEAIDVARTAKEVRTTIVTVMGGTHPTVFPLHPLSSGAVDYVVRGEGETPLRDLISWLAKGSPGGRAAIPGVCTREGENFRVSGINLERDIDVIPDRTLAEASRYRIGRKNYTTLLTSRGCPFSCAFCGKPPVPYRKRSLASIEREIKACVDLGIEAIDFEDDMLTLDIPFFRDVLSLFKGGRFTLSAMNGIYSGTLDRETLNLMWEAGFRRLNFSLVDISRQLVKKQKRTVPGRFLDLLPYLESSPFLVETHFIVGLPGQQSSDVLETLLFLMKRRVLPGPSAFYMAPGSDIFARQQGKAEVFCPGEEMMKRMRSSALLPANPLLPRTTLYTLMMLARFVNFTKLLLDDNPGMERLSEIMELRFSGRHSSYGEIISALLKEQRLIAFDTTTGEYVEVLQDRDLIGQFFAMARGTSVKGFKTTRTLVVD